MDPVWQVPEEIFTDECPHQISIRSQLSGSRWLILRAWYGEEKIFVTTPDVLTQFGIYNFVENVWSWGACVIGGLDFSLHRGPSWENLCKSQILALPTTDSIGFLQGNL